MTEEQWAREQKRLERAVKAQAALAKAPDINLAEKLRRLTNVAGAREDLRQHRLHRFDLTLSIEPKITADMWPEMRGRWMASCKPVANNWGLCVHEPWLDQGLSRVVLIQSVFMVQFEYKTGDKVAAEAALASAMQFAALNDLKRQVVADYSIYAMPACVGFSKPLGAAGWVTGDVAAHLNAVIAFGDFPGLQSLLDPLQGHVPRDYTSAVALTISQQHAESLHEKIAA